ncbi:unnamed protein product [Urochloa humidicola]
MVGDEILPTTPQPRHAAPSAPPPAAPSAPPPAAPSAPKRKVQRRPGLSPPPSTPGFGTAMPCEQQGATVKPTRKRPPRDPSSSAIAVRRVRVATAGLVPLQASSATTAQEASLMPLLASSAAPTPSGPSTAAAFTTMPEAQEVLGGMPQSMDDESFLHLMNEQTFGNAVDANMFEANTIDEEIGSDVDSELPKKKGSRGVNFTIPEDDTCESMANHFP